MINRDATCVAFSFTAKWSLKIKVQLLHFHPHTNFVSLKPSTFSKSPEYVPLSIFFKFSLPSSNIRIIIPDILLIGASSVESLLRTMPVLICIAYEQLLCGAIYIRCKFIKVFILDFDKIDLKILILI